MYQTIVIEGGPSGAMAAVAVSERNKSVLLIEKKKGFGRKLKISDGGRCNVTNRLPYDEIIKNIPGDGKFLYSPSSVFDNLSIINFFKTRGVKLKEEDHGRMFPVSNKSRDVVDVLTNQPKGNHIEVKEEAPIVSVSCDHNFKVKTQIGGSESHSLIIATSGTLVSQTGFAGDGHKFAKSLGHFITELFPTEMLITSSEAFIKSNRLKGLSLKDANLSVLKKNGKKRVGHQMGMISTYFGISGPAVLRCSQFVYKEQKNQKRKNIHTQLDVFPELNVDQLSQKVRKILNVEPDKYIKNSLRGLVGEWYLPFILEQSGINDEMTAHHLSNQQSQTFINLSKTFTFTVDGASPLDKAFVTGGGISLKEMESKTMMPKLVPELFLCGEVLDTYGYAGGYSITSVLVTGHAAGMFADEFKIDRNK